MPEQASRLPRVVALLPAWNAEAFIAGTLASLATQTYANLDLLISVDLSTDRTLAICEAFAAATPRVRCLAQPRRLGWIGNVNALLEAAAGDYFFFALHDDPVKPTYVERLVAALESHPSAVLAFTDVEVAGRRWAYSELDGATDRCVRARRLLGRSGHWWVPYRGLFRAVAARRIGGMRRHVAGEFMADWPWLLGLALQGELVRVPEPLVQKDWLQSGLSRSWRHSPWQRLGVMLACMRTVRGAGIPWRDEIALHRTVLLAPLRRRWWSLHASLRALWRRRSLGGGTA